MSALLGIAEPSLAPLHVLRAVVAAALTRILDLADAESENAS